MSAETQFAWLSVNVVNVNDVGYEGGQSLVTTGTTHS